MFHWLRRIDSALPQTALLFGCMMMLASCAGWSGEVEDFERDHLEYAQMIRWGNFDRAASWIEKDAIEEFLKNAARAGNIRFTDYSIIRKNLDSKEETAEVFVRYEVHQLNELITHNVVEKQSWKYNEKLEHWELKTTLFEEIAPMLDQ